MEFRKLNEGALRSGLAWKGKQPMGRLPMQSRVIQSGGPAHGQCRSQEEGSGSKPQSASERRCARVAGRVQQVEILYPQLRRPPAERLRAGAPGADDGARAAAVRALADEALLPQRARLVQHDREGGDLRSNICGV